MLLSRISTRYMTWWRRWIQTACRFLLAKFRGNPSGKIQYCRWAYLRRTFPILVLNSALLRTQSRCRRRLLLRMAHFGRRDNRRSHGLMATVGKRFSGNTCIRRWLDGAAFCFAEQVRAAVRWRWNLHCFMTKPWWPLVPYEN